MGAVETLGIGDKRIEAGFSTKVNCLAAILGPREVSPVRAEHPFANGMEALNRSSGWFRWGYLSAHLPTFSAGRKRKADQMGSIAIWRTGLQPVGFKASQSLSRLTSVLMPDEPFG
jgi:hypothetical protein